VLGNGPLLQLVQSVSRSLGSCGVSAKKHIVSRSVRSHTNSAEIVTRAQWDRLDNDRPFFSES
jgi:hypothetical protein